MSGNHNPKVNREDNVRVFELEPFSGEPDNEVERDRPKIEEIEDSPTSEPKTKETTPKEKKSKEPRSENQADVKKSASNRKKSDNINKEQEINKGESKPTKPRKEKNSSKMKREESPTKRPKAPEPPLPKRAVTIKENPSREIRKTDTCIDKLQATTRLWKIGLCLFLIGFLFDIMAFATPYWMVIDDATGSDVVNVGLWCTCTAISNCTFRHTPTGCLNTLRGFHGISILLCVLIGILLIMYVKKTVNKRGMGFTIIIITGLAALGTQITAGVFGKSYGCMDDVASGMPGKWGWSMALAFISIVCLSVAAVLFYVQELRGCNGGKSKWRAWLGPDIRVT